MRKAVSVFHGDAVVNRIYPNYTMNYSYVQGAVHKIVEHAGGNTRVVFEYKDTLGQLEAHVQIYGCRTRDTSSARRY